MMHVRPELAHPAAAHGVIVALLEQRTGQQIDAKRAWRIDSSLKPLLRDRGIASIDALVAQLMTARDDTLADAVVDALLNQETSFFRDAALLDQLVDAAGVIEDAAHGRRLRIWSAGCATGQEPLSLAMMFAERAQRTGRPVPEIRATDVSAAAVARARAGRFSQFEIQRGLPVRRMIQWFDANDATWTAKADLMRHVFFARQNLLDDPPPAGRFDVVLCRNVLLYLSTPLRRRVLDTLASVLRPGGLVMLGAGETVIGQTDALVPSETVRGFYRPVGTLTAG